MHKLQVRTASGSSLCPTGTITCDFKLGKQPFSFEFIICRGLSRPCILGLDFLRKYQIGIGWSPKAAIDKHMEGGLHKVVPNFLLSDEYPELVLIPTVHNVEITKIECIPYILLNLSEEAIFLRKGEILRHLEKEDITIEEITTETMLQSKDMESEKLNCGNSLKKTFIASPVSDDTCRKVRLQDVEALSHHKITIEKVTAEAMLQYKDMESEKLNCGDMLKEMFIASPVNVDTCKKVKQQDVEALSYCETSVEEITT